MDLSQFSPKDFELKFDKVLAGEICKDDVKQFLIELNQENLPVNAFIGAVCALRKKMLLVEGLGDVIDVCGTGGDKLDTLNISTAVSFVLAGAGLKVAKHGNRAISSCSGSADIFSELGINYYSNPDQIREQIGKNNLCFLFAPLFHSSLKSLAEVRKELAIPTIFNFLGPLLNPARASIQMIGTSRRDSIAKIAQVKINQFNQEKRPMKTAIIHGFDGMDEVTLSDNSYITTVIDDKIVSEEIIDPEIYGFKKINISQIKGGSPANNAKEILDLLDGKSSAYMDIVVLNSAFALRLANKAADINLAAKIARSSIMDGKAKEILSKIKDDLQIQS